MSAICTQCSSAEDSVEFPTIRDLVIHTREGHISRPKKELKPSRPVTPSATELATQKKEKPASPQVSKPASEKPEPVKPLELVYKWEGVCANCNTTPKTITVKAGGETVCIAFCLNCDKELQQRKVIAIDKQFPKEK